MRVYKNGNKMSVVYKEEFYSRLSFKRDQGMKNQKVMINKIYNNGIYYNLVGNLF